MIRAAHAEEAEQITDLLSQVIGGAQSAEQIREWIVDPRRIVMVDHLVRGVILGVSIANEAEITDVAVSPDHQRTGIGKALVRTFLDSIGGDTLRSAFLEVRASNRAAIALYRGEGFAAVGCREGYYADGEDALIFRWMSS